MSTIGKMGGISPETAENTPRIGFHREIHPTTYTPPEALLLGSPTRDPEEAIHLYLQGIEASLTFETAQGLADHFFSDLGLDASNWHDFENRFPNAAYRVRQQACFIASYLGHYQKINPDQETTTRLSAAYFLVPLVQVPIENKIYGVNELELIHRAGTPSCSFVPGNALFREVLDSEGKLSNNAWGFDLLEKLKLDVRVSLSPFPMEEEGHGICYDAAQSEVPFTLTVSTNNKIPEQAESIGPKVDVYYPLDPSPRVEWKQISGVPVTLLPSTSLFQPTLQTGVVFKDEPVTFEVTVRTRYGTTKRQEVSFIVENTINEAPTVSLKDPAPVYEGDRVHVQPTASDPNEDPLTYEWQQISGPQVYLRNPTALELYFDAPAVTQKQRLAFELIVRDGKGGEAKAPFTLTVNPLITYDNDQIQVTPEALTDVANETGGTFQEVKPDRDGNLITVEAVKKSLELPVEEIPELYQVALFVDGSGSMNAVADQIADIAALSTEQIIEKMVENVANDGIVEVALLVYGDGKIHVLLPFTSASVSDPEALARVAQALRDAANQASTHIKTKGGGIESLWDALYEGVEGESALAWVEDDSILTARRVIALTDGEMLNEENIVTSKNGVRYTAGMAQALLGQHGISFSPILFSIWELSGSYEDLVAILQDEEINIWTRRSALAGLRRYIKDHSLQVFTIAKNIFEDSGADPFLRKRAWEIILSIGIPEVVQYKIRFFQNRKNPADLRQDVLLDLQSSFTPEDLLKMMNDETEARPVRIAAIELLLNTKNFQLIEDQRIVELALFFLFNETIHGRDRYLLSDGFLGYALDLKSSNPQQAYAENNRVVEKALSIVYDPAYSPQYRLWTAGLLGRSPDGTLNERYGFLFSDREKYVVLAALEALQAKGGIPNDSEGVLAEIITHLRGHDDDWNPLPSTVNPQTREFLGRHPISEYNNYFRRILQNPNQPEAKLAEGLLGLYLETEEDVSLVLSYATNRSLPSSLREKAAAKLVAEASPENTEKLKPLFLDPTEPIDLRASLFEVFGDDPLIVEQSFTNLQESREFRNRLVVFHASGFSVGLSVHPEHSNSEIRGIYEKLAKRRTFREEIIALVTSPSQSEEREKEIANVVSLLTQMVGPGAVSTLLQILEGNYSTYRRGGALLCLKYTNEELYRQELAKIFTHQGEAEYVPPYIDGDLVSDLTLGQLLYLFDFQPEELDYSIGYLLRRSTDQLKVSLEEKHVPILCRLLEIHPKKADKLIKWMESIPDPRMIQPVRNYLKRASTDTTMNTYDRDQAISYAIRLFEKLKPTPEMLRACEEIVGSSSFPPSLRGRSLVIYAEKSGKEAISLIQNYTHDPTLRLFAIEALGKIKDKASRYVLWDLLKEAETKYPDDVEKIRSAITAAGGDPDSWIERNMRR